MNAVNYIALEAKSEGKQAVSTWGSGWNNATGSELRMIENECESLFNTDAEVQKCIQSKLGSAGKAGSGFGSRINWGNVGQSAADFISGLSNKGGGNTPVYDNSNYTPPKKDMTWLWVTLGVAAVGGAVWFFGFRNK